MKQNRKRLLGKAAPVLAALSLVSCAFVGINADTVGRAATANKTAVLDSSYYTRVMAPVAYTALTSYAGASIELDVVASDLKSAENVQWIKDIDPTLVAGSALADHPLASVTFDFWNETAAFADCAHGLIGASNKNPSSTSLNYYADGQIRLMYYGNVNNGSTRVLTPITSFNGEGELVWNEEYGESLGTTYAEGTDCVGDVNEVKTFLDAGYGYKVDFIYGFVSEDGTVTYGQSTRADGYGAIYNPWYVIYKKAIGAEEWEFSFAIPLNRGLVSGAASEGNSFAGFEICANQGWFKQSVGNGVYDNFGNNVKMEVDNVAIYSREEGATKVFCDFENVADVDFSLDDASGIKSSGRTYIAPVGNFANLGAAYRSYYDENVATVDGITFNSINAPMEGIQAPAKRSLNSRPLYTVEYKDRATGETILTRSVMKGLNAVVPSYKETGTLYVWESAATNVMEDTVIYGNENTDPFKISFDLNGGIGTVQAIEERFGKAIALPEKTEAFSREHYDFVGWAVKTEKGELKKVTKYTVSDHDDTLYALWTPSEYSVEFYNGEELLYETDVFAFTNAVYEGAEPLKTGSKFIGWSESTENITANKTLSAQFKDDYDEMSADKTATLSVAASAEAKTLFVGRAYEQAKSNVVVKADFLSVTLGGAKAYVVLGESVRVDVTEWVKSGNTVCLEFYAHGKYTVGVKSVSALRYTQVSEGLVNAPYGAGRYGFTFEIDANASFFATVDELSVYADGLAFTEEFEYLSPLENGTTFYQNGVTLIETSEANTLSVAFTDRPKAFTVTYKDKTTGETLETRNVRSGETATLYEQTGYAVTADESELAKLTGITQNVTVTVMLTAKTYSVSYHTDGVTDESAVAYGSQFILPTVEFSDAYGIVGWSRGENAVMPEYKAGATAIMPAEDLVLYPVYGYRTFTVTFKDENGGVLETKEVPYKSTAIYSGETPAKEGYKFVGWDRSVGAVSEDMIVKPVFEKLPTSPTYDPPANVPSDSCADALQTALYVVGSICFVVGAALIVLAFWKKKKQSKEVVEKNDEKV